MFSVKKTHIFQVFLYFIRQIKYAKNNKKINTNKAILIGLTMKDVLSLTMRIVIGVFWSLLALLPICAVIALVASFVLDVNISVWQVIKIIIGIHIAIPLFIVIIALPFLGYEKIFLQRRKIKK